MLCNRPYSGTAVIDDFGEEHLRTGDLIVYTSADSVLQIAAHDAEVPQAELYAACAAAREIMSGEHAVGRVIARPFKGAPGAFERTDGRKDFALDPPGRSYLDELQADGIPVHTVGKIGSVFNHVGVDHEHPGRDNPVAIAETTRLMDELDGGFVFTNLVETDQVYGHRQDVEGFHGALQAIDARRRRAGSRGWTPSATCSSSPPTTAATRRRPARTTRASTSRCWRRSPATAAAATTARSPTWGRACCAGWPGATPPRCRARRSRRRSLRLRRAGFRGECAVEMVPPRPPRRPRRARPRGLRRRRRRARARGGGGRRAGSGETRRRASRPTTPARSTALLADRARALEARGPGGARRHRDGRPAPARPPARRGRTKRLSIERIRFVPDDVRDRRRQRHGEGARCPTACAGMSRPFQTDRAAHRAQDAGRLAHRQGRAARASRCRGRSPRSARPARAHVVLLTPPGVDPGRPAVPAWPSAPTATIARDLPSRDLPGRACW